MKYLTSRRVGLPGARTGAVTPPGNNHLRREVSWKGFRTGVDSPASTTSSSFVSLAPTYFISQSAHAAAPPSLSNCDPLLLGSPVGVPPAGGLFYF